jgi:hypothetical protein
LAGWVYFPEIHELNVRPALVPACQADQQEDNGVFHAGKIQDFSSIIQGQTPQFSSPPTAVRRVNPSFVG